MVIAGQNVPAVINHITSAGLLEVFPALGIVSIVKCLL